MPATVWPTSDHIGGGGRLMTSSGLRLAGLVAGAAARRQGSESGAGARDEGLGRWEDMGPPA